MISPGLFFIFSKFWFSGLGGTAGWIKGQKVVQNNQKFCLLCSIFQEPHIIWSSIMVCKCKMIISSSVFFIFFKTLILQVFRRVKGQKMAQNDKKLCLSCLTSQEPYIIWSSFMLLMCIRIISPGFFYIYSKNFFVGGQ